MLGDRYISDPRIWKSLYQNMTDNKFVPEQYNKRQRGGGIAQMYAKKPYMISVSPHLNTEIDSDVVVGKQVTPVAAAEERAKSEMKEEIRKQSPHVAISKKSIKPMKQKFTIIRKIKSRGTTSQTKNKVKNSKKTLTKKKAARAIPRKTLKRKTESTKSYNIFNKKRRVG